jgi:hypothetical protein
VIWIQGAFVLLLAGGWLACALLRPELVDKLTTPIVGLLTSAITSMMHMVGGELLGASTRKSPAR